MLLLSLTAVHLAQQNSPSRYMYAHEQWLVRGAVGRIEWHSGVEMEN